MASNAEFSNRTKDSLPTHKNRPPRTPNSDPPLNSPKSQASTALSYTDGNQKTPTQTSGKRKIDEENHPIPPPPSQSFITPKKSLGYNPSTRPQLDPLILVQETDHVMQDPFVPPPNGHSQSINWADDVSFYTRLNKILDLLKDLHSELDAARNDQTLPSITEDEEIDEQLVKLAAILPSYTSNSMVTPVMRGISNLQELVGQMSARLQKMEAANMPPPDKSLKGSLHTTHQETF